MQNRFGIVILAAGGSSRLGRPKQLLPYQGITLVEHAAKTALASGANQVVVVVGAEADAVREKLAGLPVEIAENLDWAEGMGSSIRSGVAMIGPDVACVIIALCDQPRITPNLLRELAARQASTKAPIVASSYGGVLGVPSAFDRLVFPNLMALTGESGARELIRNSPVPVEAVEFSGGVLDVDTAADVLRLK